MTTVKYYDVAALIQTGDLFEFAGTDLLARAIRWKTGKPVNHTALVAGTLGQSQNFLLEANAPGIELERVVSDILDYKGAVYWTPLKRLYDPCRPAILAYAMDQVGKPYSYSGLFSSLLGHINATCREYICSQFAFVSRVAGDVFHNKYFIIDNAVFDIAGHPVKSPWPGEFEQFGVDDETVKIIM